MPFTTPVNVLIVATEPSVLVHVPPGAALIFEITLEAVKPAQ